MSSLPTAAVIGAGSSGIAAAKALHERGIPFTCFEASDRVGGNWVFANKNGMSAAYRQLFINTSRERMEYSDYPMPKSYPDFPHHAQIAAYFDGYVEHFGFRDRIRFETIVRHAARLPGGGWELTLGDGSVERFDALLVANGHHWDARWPEPMFRGHETFAGVQMHAHDYRDSDIFAGRRVLVLGMGNSAMDIPCELSRCSSTAPCSVGWTKLGQPHPESNLASLSNSGCPHPAQTYSPAAVLNSYSPLNGRSVPFWRRIAYCSGVSRSRHCSSVRCILSAIGFSIGEDMGISCSDRNSPRAAECPPFSRSAAGGSSGGSSSPGTSRAPRRGRTSRSRRGIRRPRSAPRRRNRRG